MFSMMPKLRGLDTGFLLQRYVLNPDDSKWDSWWTKWQLCRFSELFYFSLLITFLTLLQAIQDHTSSPKLEVSSLT
jgi:hypothetical protein